MSPTWVALVPAAVVRVTGKDRLSLLHRLTTNDLLPLGDPGRASQTLFTSEKGRIIDWVGVTAEPDALLLRGSAGRAATIAAWLDRYTIMEDVRAEDVSARYLLAIAHGDGAAALLPAVPEVGRVSADGAWVRGLAAYGSRFEGLLEPQAAEAWLAEARRRGATTADAAELEWLRLSAGVPSPAHEFEDEVNPLELRLNAGVISWTKGCYIGQEVISRLDSYDKLQRQLIGFESEALLPAGELREARLVHDGHTLGRVTSLLARPGQGSLGLAVVKREVAHPGPAELRTSEGAHPVRLADRPFWQP